MAYGFARNMRDTRSNASFIGFTGTPIEQNDANTRAVFGECISVCDIQQAVIDKATVPIFYESCIAKLSLNEAELHKVDSAFEEITAGEEEDRKQMLKTKWGALVAIRGGKKRVRLIVVFQHKGQRVGTHQAPRRLGHCVGRRHRRREEAIQRGKYFPGNR